MHEVELQQKSETAFEKDPIASQPRRRNTRVRESLFKLRALIALVLLIGVFASLSPAFLTTGNLLILAKHVAINAILATGMTYVILTGGIDLSVGSVVGLAAMIAGGLINEGLVLPMFGVVVYFNVWLIILLTLLNCSFYRHAGNNVCRARFCVVALEWRNVSQPRGQSRTRQHGISISRLRDFHWHPRSHLVDDHIRRAGHIHCEQNTIRA
jgi:hypothetical protein